MLTYLMLSAGADKVHFALDALLSLLESQKLSAVADEACLAVDAPLSVGESQTLSIVAAGPSVAHDELCLFLSSY